MKRKPSHKPDSNRRDRPYRPGPERAVTGERGSICGLKPVLEALRGGSRRIEKIVIAVGAREHRVREIIELARASGIPFSRVGRDVLERYVESGANHQGVVALATAADYADADELLDEIAAAEMPLVLILDGIEDPRNLGAIIRTAECAGARWIFIPEHRAVGMTETVIKTAAGATEFARVAKVKNLSRLIEQLKSHNIWVVGTSGEAATNYADWDWQRPSALALGSEGKGLHRLVAENCDALVRIPMQGQIESLNVSVAAGVILFEAVRQRSR